MIEAEYNGVPVQIELGDGAIVAVFLDELEITDLLSPEAIKEITWGTD